MKITAPEIDSLEEIDDLIQSLAESLGSTKEKVVSPSRKREIVQVRDTIVFFRLILISCFHKNTSSH